MIIEKKMIISRKAVHEKNLESQSLQNFASNRAHI